MKECYVFAYGSLMNTDSARKALGRMPAPEELMPATLHHYRRVWAVREYVYAHSLSSRITAVFLDIQPAQDSTVNGVLLPVNTEELSQLKRREKNYYCLEISGQLKVQGAAPSGAVYTFVSREEYRVAAGENSCYVMQQYVDKVEQGCRQYGEAFVQAYRESTGSHPFRVLPGSYTFLDEEQSRLV